MTASKKCKTFFGDTTFHLPKFLTRVFDPLSGRVKTVFFRQKPKTHKYGLERHKTKTKTQKQKKMSAYSGLLPNYRLVGQFPFWGGGGLFGASGIYNNYPLSGRYPAIADSYSPQDQTPQTRYGSCDCHGGALNHNNCNFQQGGYRPQCLLNGGCRCVDATGTDWGCFSKPGSMCT